MSKLVTNLISGCVGGVLTSLLCVGATIWPAVGAETVSPPDFYEIAKWWELPLSAWWK
jgi:hypothetical protein